MGILLLLWSLTGAAPEAAEAPARPRLLMLKLEGVGVDVDLVTLLDGSVAAALAGSADLDVVSEADLRRMIELEGQRELLGCNTESCLAEVAGALGARYVLHGRVGTLERELLLQLAIFDAATSRTVASRQTRAASADSLSRAVPDAVRALVADLGGASVAAPRSDRGLLWTGGVIAALGVTVGVPSGALALWANEQLGRPGSELGPAKKEEYLGLGRGALVALAAGSVVAAGGGVLLALAFVE